MAVPFFNSILCLAFFLSGIVVVCFQGLLYVTVRPFSTNTFRSLNAAIVETFWICTCRASVKATWIYAYTYMRVKDIVVVSCRVRSG